MLASMSMSSLKSRLSRRTLDGALITQQLAVLRLTCSLKVKSRAIAHRLVTLQNLWE